MRIFPERDRTMTQSGWWWARLAGFLGHSKATNGYGTPIYTGDGGSLRLTPWLEYNRGPRKFRAWARLEFKWADKWIGLYSRHFTYGGGRQQGGDVNVDLWFCFLTLVLHVQLHEAAGHEKRGWRIVRSSDDSPFWRWFLKDRQRRMAQRHGKFPAMPWPQRLARLSYLARCWSPRWSWYCIMRGGDGAPIDWALLPEWLYTMGSWLSIPLKGREHW